MSTAYIVAGCRTPIGKYLGILSGVRSVELGGHAIRQAVNRGQLAPESIDQVIMGQVIQAAVGQAPARQASTLAGLPSSVGAVTVNKVCGSGLYSVMVADMAIRAGQYHRVIAGGMESMSLAPHTLRGGRAGWRYGEQSLEDAIETDGLRCAYSQLTMGCIAQWVAQQAHVSRQEQDQWALRSHHRATVAQDAFEKEIVSVPTVNGRVPVLRGQDEGPRRDASLEGLANLKPAFPSKISASHDQCTFEGSVTAGNASSLSDGAAALTVVHESCLQNATTDWSFRICGHTTFASDHQKIFTAPVGAVRKLLTQLKLSSSDIDLFEINEAFAAQTIACVRELELDEEKVNVNGGAIALGHPLGCSGARVLVSLLHALAAQNKTLGLATLCLGGGEAVAMVVERSK